MRVSLPPSDYRCACAQFHESGNRYAEAHRLHPSGRDCRIGRSFTKHILRRKGDHVRFVALETNPRLFAFLAERWEPACFAQRSAEELRDTLNERVIQRAGAIVSGLPWASLGRVLQKSILQQVSACLAPEGVFVTFAYPQGLLLPGGIRFRRLLDQQFASVERTKVVWKNLPPAFVYVCRKQAGALREAA